jgi:methionyl-tRNA synthetase
MDDIDLNLEDFVARVNSDLIGKLVNIASRCAGFITRHFDGRLSGRLDDDALYKEFSAVSETVAAHYESREFSKAMRVVMSLADQANRYIEERKPWAMAKDPQQLANVQAVCTQGLNLFRALMVYLTPVMPSLAADAQRLFKESTWNWQAAATPLLASEIADYQPLLTRIDPKDVQKMVEQSKVPESGVKSASTGSALPKVSIDEFLKVDLRVARIQQAEHVDGADKLLKLTLDLGGESRTVFAGIKAAYEPEALVGRHVIAVANLEPRQMRFGTSEGMVLAAGPGGSDIFLLSVDEGATPGMRVK